MRDYLHLIRSGQYRMLDLAVVCDSMEHVKLAIAEGEDIHAKDEQALRLAVEKGHLDIMKYLVEKGVGIIAKSYEALMTAAKEGHTKIVEYILSLNAINQLYADEALNVAAQNGQFETVKYLVKHGADAGCCDDSLLSFLELKGYHEIADYIEAVRALEVLGNQQKENKTDAERSKISAQKPYEIVLFKQKDSNKWGWQVIEYDEEKRSTVTGEGLAAVYSEAAEKAYDWYDTVYKFQHEKE